MFEIAGLRVFAWVSTGGLLCTLGIFISMSLGLTMYVNTILINKEDVAEVSRLLKKAWINTLVLLCVTAVVMRFAWPYVYDAVWAGFWKIFFTIAVLLFIQSVILFYRNVWSTRLMQMGGDIILLLSALLASFLLGLMVGNVIQGISFYYDSALQVHFTASIKTFFNPFAVLCGLMSIIMMGTMSGYYLMMRVKHLKPRVLRMAQLLGIVLLVLVLMSGLWIALDMDGYVILQMMGHGVPVNPINKEVARQVGAWITIYYNYPILLIVPVTAVLSTVIVIIAALRQHYQIAVYLSYFIVFCVIATVIVSMFPFILPASTQVDSSLLVWDSAGSQWSLRIMSVVSIVTILFVMSHVAWNHKYNAY